MSDDMVEREARGECVHLHQPTRRKAVGAEIERYGPYVYDEPMVCQFCGHIDAIIPAYGLAIPGGRRR
jgi:hypothetical protein